MDVVRQIAARIRALRTQAMLSREELAARCDLTVKHLQRIERAAVTGKGNPTLETLVRIATALGCTLDELVRPTSTQQPTKRKNVTKRMPQRRLSELSGQLPDDDAELVLRFAEKLLGRRSPKEKRK